MRALEIDVQPYQARSREAPAQLSQEGGVAAGNIEMQPAVRHRHPRRGPALDAAPADVKPVNLAQHGVGISRERVPQLLLTVPDPGCGGGVGCGVSSLRRRRIITEEPVGRDRRQVSVVHPLDSRLYVGGHHPGGHTSQIWLAR